MARKSTENAFSGRIKSSMKLYSQVYVYHRIILYDVNKDQYQVPGIETQSEQLQITLSPSQDFTCF